jgi:hypothetical protein
MRRIWFVVIITIAAAIIAASGADTSQPTQSPRIISHIPRQPVESTALAAVGYSKRHHILEIKFMNEAVYRYLDVAPSVYRDLMSAESKTRYYNMNIKGNYRSLRVRPRRKEQLKN